MNYTLGCSPASYWTCFEHGQSDHMNWKFTGCTGCLFIRQWCSLWCQTVWHESSSPPIVPLGQQTVVAGGRLPFSPLVHRTIFIQFTMLDMKPRQPFRTALLYAGVIASRLTGSFSPTRDYRVSLIEIQFNFFDLLINICSSNCTVYNPP